MKCLSQGHDDALHFTGTELRADNLAIANLCVFPLSVTATNWDNGVEILSQGHYSMLRPVWTSN